MTLQEALAELGQAGRMLGSGPAYAAEKMGALVIRDSLMKLNVPQENAAPMALGIIVGLIIAEDPSIMEQLRKIETDWRKGSA